LYLQFPYLRFPVLAFSAPPTRKLIRKSYFARVAWSHRHAAPTTENDRNRFWLLVTLAVGDDAAISRTRVLFYSRIGCLANFDSNCRGRASFCGSQYVALRRFSEVQSNGTHPNDDCSRHKRRQIVSISAESDGELKFREAP